jgi:hypothetical protein
MSGAVLRHGRTTMRMGTNNGVGSVWHEVVGDGVERARDGTPVAAIEKAWAMPHGPCRMGHADELTSAWDEQLLAVPGTPWVWHFSMAASAR